MFRCKGSVHKSYKLRGYTVPQGLDLNGPVPLKISPKNQVALPFDPDNDSLSLGRCAGAFFASVPQPGCCVRLAAGITHA